MSCDIVLIVSDSSEPFARFTLDGDRFLHARLPVDALAELQRYRRLVLAGAKRAWLLDHPGLEEVPDDFEGQFELTIANVEEGSAVSVLERSSASPYADYYDDGRNELEREIATALSDVALEAAMDDETWASEDPAVPGAMIEGLGAWSDSLPLASLEDFRDLGSTLRPSESLKLPIADAEDLVLTPANRERNILPVHARALRHATPPVALRVPRLHLENLVAGRLVMLDADEKRFILDSLIFGKVNGKYKSEELTEDLRSVLNSSARAPVVRIEGRLSFAGTELKSILEAKTVELLEIDGAPWSRRFIELASLAPGWGEDGESGEMISFAALDAARDFLNSKPIKGRRLPGIFPMGDGGVQLEWASKDRVTSIEISPEVEFEIFDLRVESRTVKQKATSNFKAAKKFLGQVIE